MANKSRPKKTRGVFYKKYVYGAVSPDVDDYEDWEENDNWDITSIDNKKKLVKSKKNTLEGKFGNLSLNNNEKLDESDIILNQQMKFPLEIILKILEYTPKPYITNHLLLCRAIYWSFLCKIYLYPKLTSNNLLTFLDVISGDNAAHVNHSGDINSITKNLKLAMKRKFQEMVKCLDLSGVVQSGKNSYMSKLLRRTSASLEIFISSQSSFGAAPLVSIKSCLRLKVLDLRLVSESVNLSEMFKSIEYLPELEQLCFPRSSVTCDEFDFKWPQNLWYLRLQGGITDKFATHVRFPATITNLEFAHCPHLTKGGLESILLNIGINLTRLSITYPMPKIGDKGADQSFLFCPNLKNFFIDIQYISWELFSEEFLVILEEYDRPLKSITIESTGYMGMCDKLSPNDITVAVDEDRLPCLERLGLSAMLGWDFKSEDMSDMVNELDHHNIEVFKI
ncbi:hypothetical protein C6P42_004509 [Pichia californica]|nr:hypothetical protein C6P42_004509 [[Candida] californica]